MLRLLDCLETEHDWRLVVLASAVCLLTSFAALNTYQRASANGRFSMAWLLTAGIMTGVGIWATHFIAILAFTPGFESLRIGLTVLSLGLAVAMVTAGFALSLARDSIWFRAAGGVLVGGAIAAMHYTGVAALDMRVAVTWSMAQVAASIVLGLAFSVAAMTAAGAARTSAASLMTSAALLALAIVVHHFVGMSAMLLASSSGSEGTAPAARIGLSIAIAVMMAIVIVGCTISAIIDRRARVKMAERNLQLNAALNNMSQGLCLFDANGGLRLFNPRFMELYGLRPDAVTVGATIDDLARAREAAGTMFQTAGDSPERRDAANRIVKLADGRTISITSNALSDGGWVVTHNDITQRLEDEERIAHMALHDPLTDLANRTAFDKELDRVVRQTSQSGSHFALISIDLDQFKQVNDLFGHTVGDRLLHAVAQRLRGAANGAFVARLASDEFTIISTASPQPGKARAICERIMAALADEIEVCGICIRAHCSVGVSIFPHDGTDIQTLRTHADVALHRAKTRQNSAVCFFEPVMDEQINAYRELQRDFAAAVTGEQLELYFQPQASAAGEIIAFEVLLRWVDSKRGPVAADIFIPLAEELGLIPALDAWVLRAACREAASWDKPLAIAVNLSAASFASADVVGLVGSILQETGLPSSRLEIEITETLLIADFTSVTATLHRVKALGVQIAMDDFGTGYSSLSYLQSFPFDKLKIDKSFVSAAATNANSPLILTAIIGLGKALKLKVLAEGVETNVQRDFLVQKGCDELQGFLIGRPKPIGHYRSLVMQEETKATYRKTRGLL